MIKHSVKKAPKHFLSSILDKQPDLVRQAVHGLLKLDDVSDESTQASEEHTNSEGERRLPRGGLLAQVRFPVVRGRGGAVSGVQFP